MVFDNVMSGETEQTEEVLSVPVTRSPKDIILGLRWATGHIDGRPYVVNLSLNARHLSILIDTGDEWVIDVAELAFAVRKRADDIDKEAR